ncbi:MAG TPA: L-aspartate oxidase [Thermoplasmata archaeon]|nr:L-aspartate oxidase [Thermoplasmata archaeon]
MVETDVLIIGTGIAGCVTALELAKSGIRVSLITKAEELKETNTRKAQGGIIYKGEGDSPELLRKDIMKAGDQACWEPAVETVAREGPGLVKKLLIEEYGVEFTRDEKGEFSITNEAGHSLSRVLHAEDKTGEVIEEGLIKAVKRQKNIKIYGDHVLIDLLTYEHHVPSPLSAYKEPTCLGAYIFDVREKRVKKFLAKTTVLATGGLGQLFAYTINPSIATGDGFAAAYRAGAKLINMEYIQFHPTAFYRKEGCDFLISETVRGEGGRLKNLAGEEFMLKYSKQGSLATRDVVARAIHQEMIERKEGWALLDLASYGDGKWIKRRFPTIYEECMKHGIDITKQSIPVVPAAHFACGGVKTDLEGCTNLNHLYAVGEVACTGLHGANRLASTSLLECLVWGHRAAKHVERHWKSYESFDTPEVPGWIETGRQESDPALIYQDWDTIKNTMWNYVGLVRSTQRLTRANHDLQNLWQEIEEFYRNARLNRMLIELRHGIQTALVVANAAWRNKQSIGCHYRVD